MEQAKPVRRVIRARMAEALRPKVTQSHPRGVGATAVAPNHPIALHENVARGEAIGHLVARARVRARLRFPTRSPVALGSSP